MRVVVNEELACYNEATLFFSTNNLQEQEPGLAFSRLFKTSTPTSAHLPVVATVHLRLDVTQLFTHNMFYLKCCIEFRGHEYKCFLYIHGPKMSY